MRLPVCRRPRNPGAGRDRLTGASLTSCRWASWSSRSAWPSWCRACRRSRAWNYPSRAPWAWDFSTRTPPTGRRPLTGRTCIGVVTFFLPSHPGAAPNLAHLLQLVPGDLSIEEVDRRLSARIAVACASCRRTGWREAERLKQPAPCARRDNPAAGRCRGPQPQARRRAPHGFLLRARPVPGDDRRHTLAPPGPPRLGLLSLYWPPLAAGRLESFCVRRPPPFQLITLK